MLGSVSALAMALAGPVYAQSDSAVNTAVSQDTQTIETVTVTARRAALQSAQQIKENSDQIVDAVVADQAGKLPDNSITEVLARIPGVTIGRFAAVSDPDHYSIEGSGVAVRGLTQVANTLNGRSDFSANGSRGLLWEDVPPELMAAVSVYKSSTADQIEGGIGGSVDLRTHMPFDFDGLRINASVDANYGDFIGQVRPGASLLMTNRWDTKLGEIGLLVDVAYSDLSYRMDTYQMEPYFLQTLNTLNNTVVASGTAGATAKNVFVPGGFDWRTSVSDRKRMGFYEAFQWRPTSRLQVFQTFFQSAYHSDGGTYAMYYANGTHEVIPVGASYTTTQSGMLTSTTALNYDNQSDPFLADPVEHCPVANCAFTFNNTGMSRGNNRTTDISGGFQWDATDNLFVSGSYQYVHSTGNNEGLDLFTQASVSNISMKMNGNNLPTVVFTDPSLSADPTRATWDAEMDHAGRNSGQQTAANLDAKYEFAHDHFIRAIKGGIRYANLLERDRGTRYSWHSLSPSWLTYGGVSVSQYTRLSDHPEHTMLVKFDNFFRGDVPPPATVILPSYKYVGGYDAAAVAAKYGLNVWVPYWWFTYNSQNDAYDPSTDQGAAYTPATGPNLALRDTTISGTTTKTAYLMAEFGLDDVWGMPLDGNIGVRVVNNWNRSYGYVVQNHSFWQVINSTVKYEVPAGDTLFTGGTHYTKALPSFNVQIMPNEKTHIRFALSQSLSNPSFGQLAASGSAIGFNGCPGAPPSSPGYTTIDPTGACYVGTTTLPLTGHLNGDPFLKPQVSDNMDISAEWYGENQSAVHVGLFLKSIHNFMAYGTFNSMTQVPLGNSGLMSQPLPLQTSGWYNQAGVATIRGVEFGGTKFFDFLPDPFDGLGIDANFTYIDSRSPGSQSCQLFNNAADTSTLCGGKEAIRGLPVEQLSKYNYNLTGMYEKGSWSVRLAYNWRSKYLLVASGANGTQTLPVFSAPYGQLDGGVQYKINDMFTLGVDGQNLLQATAYTLMGFRSPTYGNLQAPRNWFASDSRYVATLKFNY
ncbi:MAG: TonB-dependent receptor [Alphaproteobacteria bacterium]|nr:TonB-dependent receptor [Alphaproteobacteria bacterium]